MKLDFHIDDSPTNCVDVKSESGARPILIVPDNDRTTVASRRSRMPLLVFSRREPWKGAPTIALIVTHMPKSSVRSGSPELRRSAPLPARGGAVPVQPREHGQKK